MWNGTGMGGMSGFWLFGLLLVIGVTLLVVLAVRSWGGGISRDPGTGTGRSPRAGKGRQGQTRARDVLQERYARGEVSTEDYRERLQTLGENV
ncbi:MAG: SHOCT domain-containing protein [Geodermatophilaceae bacterium]